MRGYFHRHKRFSVLNFIRRMGPSSVPQVSAATGLDRKVVTSVLGELNREGLVRQKELGASTGGRRPRLFELDPQFGIAVGVDIGLTHTRAVAVDIKGELIAGQTTKTVTGEGLIEGAIETIEMLLTKTRITRMLGIGVAMAGLLDPERTLVIFSPKFGSLKNLPLGKIIGDRFGVPVYLEDNARAMALGEKEFGVGRETDNFLCVNLATGIGLGIVINGQLYQGASNCAGELGHIVVEPAGPRCVCGNYGCLEVMASGLAIARQAQDALQQGVASSMREMVKGRLENITAKTVCQAAKSGDKLAFTIIEKAANYLAVGLAAVINLFNPEVIILAGGLSLAGDVIWEPINRRLKVHALEMPLSKVNIVFSELGELLGALGATTLVLNRIFEPTGLVLPKGEKGEIV